MKNEVWKDIPNYEGRYQASTFGRIKSINSKCRKTDVIMSNRSISMCGYQVVNLKKDGNRKSFMVHRLVAMTFIPNPNNYPIVNHKNENKLDNRVENLEWCDLKYNSSYGTIRNRIAEKLGKRVLCVELDLVFPSIGAAARNYGLHYQNISRCCRNQNRTAGGYHWKFTE